MEIEIWKKIEGYRKYEVSSFGRIRSITNTGKIKILRPQANKKGYLRIWLSEKGIKKRFLIHRLIAQAFIPNPHGKKEINHIDFDRSNNHISNLEWITHKENCIHSSNNARKSALKAKHSKTGQHYIYKRNNSFRFSFKEGDKFKTKQFKNIDDAITYRNNYLSYEI